MILQRYMDLPKFVSLLQSKSIYLAKMAAFDDALEGGLTVGDFFKVSNSAAIIDVALNCLWPVHNESQEERGLRLSRASKLQDDLRDRRFVTPFGEYACDDAEQLFPRCRQWLFVSCWHQSPHECSAMWKIYGNDRNAVCIFTTIEKLKESVSPCESLDNVEFREVSYIDHVDYVFSSDPLAPFIAKSKPYTFENEFRVVAWDSKVDLLKSDINNDTGTLLSVNLDKLIDKVVVSPHSDHWFKNSVKMICDKSGLSVDVVDSSIKMAPIKNIYDAMSYKKLNQPDS